MLRVVKNALMMDFIRGASPGRCRNKATDSLGMSCQSRNGITTRAAHRQVTCAPKKRKVSGQWISVTPKVPAWKRPFLRVTRQQRERHQGPNGCHTQIIPSELQGPIMKATCRHQGASYPIDSHRLTSLEGPGLKVLVSEGASKSDETGIRTEGQLRSMKMIRCPWLSNKTVWSLRFCWRT